LKSKDEAWAFFANTYGPWWKTPKRVLKKSQLDGWWTSCGSADVKKMGLHETGGVVCFASRDKKEVQRFIDGFMAARRLVACFVSS
jgi:hypothetical protein